MKVPVLICMGMSCKQQICVKQFVAQYCVHYQPFTGCADLNSFTGRTQETLTVDVE